MPCTLRCPVECTIEPDGLPGAGRPSGVTRRTLPDGSAGSWARARSARLAGADPEHAVRAEREAAAVVDRAGAESGDDRALRRAVDRAVRRDRQRDDPVVRGRGVGDEHRPVALELRRHRDPEQAALPAAFTPATVPTGVTCPDGVTRRIRALSRSVTNAPPSGQERDPHGTSSPDASTRGAPIGPGAATSVAGAVTVGPDDGGAAAAGASAPEQPARTPARRTAVAAARTRERDIPDKLFHRIVRAA